MHVITPGTWDSALNYPPNRKIQGAVTYMMCIEGVTLDVPLRTYACTYACLNTLAMLLRGS